MIIDGVYEDVLLAAAAYADRGVGDNPDVVLFEKGFTAGQIKQFKSNYSVESFEKLPNGFAAVVFANNITGKKQSHLEALNQPMLVI